MGIQGPLAALALGRSPYDETFDGQGVPDHREPPQQFDQRGRPINPETKKLNRDLIRAHNEVMLVIGVAEPENPNAGPEAERALRHYAHEDAVGRRLGNVAQQCVQAVGVFGVTGARQRILVYSRYSQIPFWDMYEQARRNFSFPSMVFAGAPTSLLSNYLEAKVARLWLGNKHRQIARKFVHEGWSYIKVHLELFAAMQHLGILPQKQMFPHPSFFIPFSMTSPMPAPVPLREFTGPAILAWTGQVIACALPFIIWISARRLYRDLRPRVWTYILQNLPSTMFTAKGQPLPPPPPLPVPETPTITPAEGPTLEGPEVDAIDQNNTNVGTSDDIFESPTPLSNAEQAMAAPESSAATTGVLETRADDIPTDEEDNEGLSATLISFDVEATDSAEAPAGLWSAELRPSAGPEIRPLTPVHLDTGLTQMPVGLACDILTDGLVRLMVAPYEAMALRPLAAIFLLRQGLSAAAISRVVPFEGLTLTAVVNFLSIELLSLALSGELWAAFTQLARYFHRTEEQWREDEEALASSWWYNYLSS